MLRFGSHRFGSNRATHLKSPKNNSAYNCSIVSTKQTLNNQQCFHFSYFQGHSEEEKKTLPLLSFISVLIIHSLSPLILFLLSPFPVRTSFILPFLSSLPPGALDCALAWRVFVLCRFMMFECKSQVQIGACGAHAEADDTRGPFALELATIFRHSQAHRSEDLSKHPA